MNTETDQLDVRLWLAAWRLTAVHPLRLSDPLQAVLDGGERERGRHARMKNIPQRSLPPVPVPSTATDLSDPRRSKDTTSTILFPTDPPHFPLLPVSFIDLVHL